MRVMFYVQHLLGIGHIRRAGLLSTAMSQHGLDVTVVLGGRPVKGMTFGDVETIQLPSAHVADHTFIPLLDETDRPVDRAWKDRRKDQLLAAFNAIKPDVVIIEMYPFGRRQFRFELLPLLEAAKTVQPRPYIASSVRDILVHKSKPGRDREIIDLVRRYFDLVLVHGDQNMIRLEDTFPEAQNISDLIRYTGYIAPPMEDNHTTNGTDEVIVSAGGGSVGLPLFEAALKTREQCRLAHKTWRFVTGPNLPEAGFRKLCAHGGDTVIIERFRDDLPQLLGNCALSISQGGYNTVMELLRGKARSIVVPYDDGQESEQLQRARLLAQRHILNVVEAGNLSADTLSKAIDDTMATTFSDNFDIDLSGAETSAFMIAELMSPKTTPGYGHG